VKFSDLVSLLELSPIVAKKRHNKFSTFYLGSAEKVNLISDVELKPNVIK